MVDMRPAMRIVALENWRPAMNVPKPDIFGRRWNLSDEELCSECGQPDNCGDCSHRPLSDEDFILLNSDEA